MIESLPRRRSAAVACATAALPSRQPCRAPGFVYIKPAVLLPVGGEVTLIFLSCPRCVPPWFIEHMPADRPPWLRAGWGPDDHYRCPACRGRIDSRFHGPAWRPSYSRNAEAPHV
jgi:hypothetical protein